jgi:hypothetical protein
VIAVTKVKRVPASYKTSTVLLLEIVEI